MGKTTKIDYPSSSVSTFNVNGLPLSTTSTNGENFSANYNFSPAQTEINDYVETSLLTNLPKVNTLSSGSTENIDKQIDAYLSGGINTINEVYKPMIQELENDAAKRFGNLDNSIFMDNLSDLELSRSQAVSALAQDVEVKKSNLVDNALTNQYDYLNFLTNYQNQIYNNMLNTLQLNNSSLSSNTDYLSEVYETLVSSGNSNSTNYQELGDILKSITTAIVF